jgi:hypothetical protein
LDKKFVAIALQCFAKKIKTKNSSIEGDEIESWLPLKNFFTM